MHGEVYTLVRTVEAVGEVQRELGLHGVRRAAQHDALAALHSTAPFTKLGSDYRPVPCREPLLSAVLAIFLG